MYKRICRVNIYLFLSPNQSSGKFNSQNLVANWCYGAGSQESKYKLLTQLSKVLTQLHMNPLTNHGATIESVVQSQLRMSWQK